MIITNANIITFDNQNPLIKECEILIEGGVIKKIEKKGGVSQKYPDEPRVDAKNHFVMPGNICAHTHFYGAFARGLGIPGDAPDAFPAILEKLWWKLDKSLAAKDVEYSTKVCLLDAIKHGTTTLIDHHASPHAIAGSLDVIAESVLASGLRASLCYEVTDRDGKQLAEEGIKENIRFIELTARNQNFSSMISAMFGLHASLTLSDETLHRCRQLSPKQTGFHIHAAEHPVDEYDSLKRSGMRVIERLNRHGILGQKSIVAHAVHVDASEINLLRETKTWVTHQPRSNMNNAVGMSSVESMLDFGVRVGLGNDGFSNAMWDEWRTAYLVHKLWNLDPRRMGADRVVKMAVENNSELVNNLFGNIQVGKVQEGATADLIIVDYQPFTEMTAGNLPWHIMFGFRDSMVETTIVNGKILMEDRELKTMDEEKITREAMNTSRTVWKKFQKQFNDK
jgi:putative selenium metabolism protein SsnA